ncbi:MAG TPA: hypothetical protein VMF67_09175 [Rhizomicrobium sp.]|nr:hypothetical protein [Rhizomicrobium sp.]
MHGHKVAVDFARRNMTPLADRPQGIALCARQVRFITSRKHVDQEHRAWRGIGMNIGLAPRIV